jgi:putative acetyltransferase
MLRSERPSDADAIRAVHDAAFPTTAEGELVDALRLAHHHIASLVCEQDGIIVGHVLFSYLDCPIRAVALGPVAVRPEYRRLGIASDLIHAGIDQCRVAGVQVILVLGAPEFYRRFGFSSAWGRWFSSPYASLGDAWMALPLLPVAVAYPPPWSRF